MTRRRWPRWEPAEVFAVLLLVAFAFTYGALAALNL